MKVVARHIDEENLPRRPDGTFEIPIGQVVLTPGQEYRVHSVISFEGRLKFIVLDDSDWPKAYPVALFELTDKTVPPDWMCNVFRVDQPGAMVMVMGPEFIAKDASSYSAIINLERDAMRLFRKRLDWLFEREVLTLFESVENEIPPELYGGVLELMEQGERAEALEIVCWELMGNDSLDRDSWEKCVELGKELNLDEGDTVNWRFWKRLVDYGEQVKNENVSTFSESVQNEVLGFSESIQKDVLAFFESVENEIPPGLYGGVLELMKQGETAEALEIVCWELMENNALDRDSWGKCMELGKEWNLDEGDTVNWRFWKRLVDYGEKIKDER